MSRLACFLILASCSLTNGSGGTSTPPSDAPGRTTASEGVTITAANVHEVPSVATITPAKGHLFVAIDITLDDAGTKPAALNPAQFSLETMAGVAFTASPVTSEYPSPCDASASVQPGAKGSCSAVFEVDSSSLTQLIYTLADGTTATVAVSLPTRMPGGGGLGAPCGSASCAAPLQCLGGSGFESTCEATCAGTSDTSCSQLYSGSGTIACFPGGSAALCVIECSVASQCPGDLACGMGFCQPPPM
jgi:hypothetical protein